MSDVETQLVRELRRIANVPDGSSFEIRHEGVRIRVEYTSGSSSSLVLFVPYDEVAGSGRAGAGYRGQTALSAIRPMNITLRPETRAERLGNATRGVFADAPTPLATERRSPGSSG